MQIRPASPAANEFSRGKEVFDLRKGSTHALFLHRHVFSLRPRQRTRAGLGSRHVQCNHVPSRRPSISKHLVTSFTSGDHTYDTTGLRSLIADAHDRAVTALVEQTWRTVRPPLFASVAIYRRQQTARQLTAAGGSCHQPKSFSVLSHLSSVTFSAALVRSLSPSSFGSGFDPMCPGSLDSSLVSSSSAETLWQRYEFVMAREEEKNAFLQVVFR